jgi:hypothetical protein
LTAAATTVTTVATGTATNIGGMSSVTIGAKAVVTTGFVAADIKGGGSATGNLQKLGGITAGTV